MVDSFMDTFVYKNLSIDFNTRLITSSSAELPLDPKAFNALALLVEHSDRVVTNDDLIKGVWDDRPINNDVVTASIGRVRKLFKGAGVNSEVIRTVHKVGYQFVLEQGSEYEATTDKSKLKFLIRLNGAILVGLLVGAAMLLTHFFNGADQNENNNVSLQDPQNAEIGNTENTNALAVKTRPTEIFFIRHADIVSDGTDDPPLSELGFARANRWRYLLEGIEFDYIYTTRFIRNIQTVETLFGKDLNNLRYYSALSFDITSEMQKFTGKKVAIMGHSNTIPGMVNGLVTEREYDAMDYRNYELMYQVTIDSSGGVTANELRLDYVLDK